MVRRALAVIGVAVAAGAGASVAQADTVYPPQEKDRSFNLAPDWQSGATECQLLGAVPIPVPLLCQTNNQHRTDVGAPKKDEFDPVNPGGSLEANFQAIANLGGVLFSGSSIWTSPIFQINGTPDAITGATFSYQRQAVIEALVQSGGTATSKVELLTLNGQGAVAKRKVLLEEEITEENSDFTATRAVPVEKAEIPPGTLYKLEITTTFTTSQIQLAQGTIAVNYDNVKLRVADGTANPGDVPDVTTLLATNVGADRATLNGVVNPRSTTNDAQTKFQVREVGTEPFTDVPGPTITRGMVPQEFSSVTTSLAPCKTYEYRAVATTVQTAEGALSRFSTSCGPTATTLPASPVTATGAGLNSTINPNGRTTTYQYELSLTPDFQPNTFVQTEARQLDAGRESRQPNTEQVSGLRPSTKFFYRVKAVNDLGTVLGNVQEFTTPQQSGPGAPGAPGAPGRPGAPGAPGAPGPSGRPGVDPASEPRFLRIRQSLVQVGLRGRRAGQIRLKIFCSARTGRSCAGTVKLRTIAKINPSSRRGVRKSARRVTFATFEYQLGEGKSGVAIAQMSPEKIDLLRLRRGLGRSIGITIAVQVTGASGNRQTIVRQGALRLVNSPR